MNLINEGQILRYFIYQQKGKVLSPEGAVSKGTTLGISLTLHIGANYQGEKEEITNTMRLVKDGTWKFTET